LETSDFLIDPDGRWFFLGTDRVRPADADAGGSTPDAVHWAVLARDWLGVAPDDPDRLDQGWLGALSRPDLEAAPAWGARVAEILSGGTGPDGRTRRSGLGRMFFRRRPGGGR